eukprot:TRINITY_DN4098_c0_g1_i1.p1 TRINITY_DN4098_c0_g1~~TRINITY_DN4098_c0_g1_i1.p1  ORF type:complete len:188 (-),score=33.48 TRINITY_DN4098_c0_g1_i1:42-605(-)
MGRIAWADAHARKVTNDSFTFYDIILRPLLNDLLATTWLWERFTCQATPTHNPFYHEYPETVAMLIREIAYGISVEFNTVTIAPMLLPNNTQASWHYELGVVDISYTQEQVFIFIPFIQSSDKTFVIESLLPSTNYTISNLIVDSHKELVETVSEFQEATNEYGTLSFTTTTGATVACLVKTASTDN